MASDRRGRGSGRARVHTVLRAVLIVLLAVGGLTGARAADDAVFEARMLPASAADASVETVASGALDDQLETFEYFAFRRHADPFWLKLEAVQHFAPPGVASLNVRKARQLDVPVVALDAAGPRALRLATKLARLGGT